MDHDLPTLSDQEVRTAVDEILAGRLPAEHFSGFALSAGQAMLVADGVRGSAQREEVIRIGRILEPAGSAERFFDPARPAVAPRIVLRRDLQDGVERFELLTHIGYWDDVHGGVIVPGEQSAFRSDLTSVPSFFTWLVPRTGAHLPAALVHDGLVLTPGEPRSYVGPDVSREEADRILREGMRHLGTGVVRAWLVWAAVALATLWSDPRVGRRWRWRLVISVTVALVAVLGGIATLDVFDCGNLLPWMGDRPLWAELALGAVAALVVPVVLAALLWHGRRRLGMILGVSLAFLLHVTAAIVAVYQVYALAEAAAARSAQRALTALGLLGLVVGVPALLAWALCVR